MRTTIERVIMQDWIPKPLVFEYDIKEYDKHFKIKSKKKWVKRLVKVFYISTLIYLTLLTFIAFYCLFDILNI